MKRIILILVIGIFISGCVTLAPPKQREIRNVIKVKLKKDEIYNRAMVFFAKFYVDSNSAIKLKDSKTGRIVAHAKIECSDLDKLQFLNKVYVYFNIDFQAKDNRYRLTFDDIIHKVYSNTQYGESETLQGPSNKDDTIEIDNKCLAPIRNNLKKAISTTLKTDDDF